MRWFNKKKKKKDVAGVIDVVDAVFGYTTEFCRKGFDIPEGHLTMFLYYDMHLDSGVTFILEKDGKRYCTDLCKVGCLTYYTEKDREEGVYDKFKDAVIKNGLEDAELKVKREQEAEDAYIREQKEAKRLQEAEYKQVINNLK